MIPEWSSVLGFGSERPIRLDRVSHTNACRFEDMYDPNYRRIQKRLLAEIDASSVGVNSPVTASE